jgi:hypothetical protein
MTQVRDDISEQVAGALAGLGDGPFVAQADCVDVLLDLYRAADGTPMQPLVAASLAGISRVNLVPVGDFRRVLVDITALAAVAAAVEDVDDGAVSDDAVSDGAVSDDAGEDAGGEAGGEDAGGEAAAVLNRA